MHLRDGHIGARKSNSHGLNDSSFPREVAFHHHSLVSVGVIPFCVGSNNCDVHSVSSSSLGLYGVLMPGLPIVVCKFPAVNCALPL